MSDSNHNNDNNNHDNPNVNSSSQENSQSNEENTSSSDNLTEHSATFYLQPGQSDQDMIHQITEFINSFSNIQQTENTTNIISPEQLTPVMSNIPLSLNNNNDDNIPNMQDNENIPNIQDNENISNIQDNENNTQNSENVQMMFEIEFIMNPNGIVQEEEIQPHFENCQQINDIIGKPLYIKKDDELIESDCNICMDHFEYRQYKRTLPKCNHTFHKKCIDSWLKKNSSCPICRQEYLPSQD